MLTDTHICLSAYLPACLPVVAFLRQILINNAGVYGRRLGLAELEAGDFAYAMQTNAIGPFLVVQQLLKQGLLGPPGSLVVNVTSIMASQGDQTVSSVTLGGYAYRCVVGSASVGFACLQQLGVLLEAAGGDGGAARWAALNGLPIQML